MAVFVGVHTHTCCVRPGLNTAVRVEFMGRQVPHVREMSPHVIVLSTRTCMSFPCINSQYDSPGRSWEDLPIANYTPWVLTSSVNSYRKLSDLVLQYPLSCE